MTAGADIFFDTNVLLYAAFGAAEEPRKHEIAVGLLPMRFGVSGQVLAEFYWNATRKGARPLSPEVARSWVYTLAKKAVQTVDERVVLMGIDVSQRYQISYWDGAIIAAARYLGTPTVYSEDLSHGQVYEGVTVINPFLEQ